MNYKLIKEKVDEIFNGAYDWKFESDNTVKYNGKVIPLAFWRHKHRLLATRNLTTVDKLLKRVCSYKSERFEKASSCVFEMLRQELDALEWLLDEKITSIYAIEKNEVTIMAIVKTNNDTLCQINVAATLAEDTKPIIKHEFVGEEGMASDRTINEQVPVEAIYVFNKEDKYPKTYTDIDFGMLGLTEDEVVLADSVAAIFLNENAIDEYLEIDARSRFLLEKAKEALKTGETIVLEEA